MNLPHALTRAARASLVLAFFAFPMSVALANVALLLALLLWLPSLWGAEARGHLREALHNPLAAPALALFAWVVVAIAWSPAEPRDALGFLQKYLKFALVPMFIALLQDATTRRRCWQGFALALGFTLLVTWLNVWFDFPWTRTHNQGFGVDHTVFKDYISQGLMMTIFAAVCVFLAFETHERPRQALWWLLWLLASVSILLLLQGRTGYLAWAGSTTVLALGLALHRSRVAVGVTLVALAALFTVAVVSSPVLQQRWKEAWVDADKAGSGPITSVGARVEMAEFAFEQIRQAPLLGHGTASYPVLSKQHFMDKDRCSVQCTHPHNQFLFFHFEQGAIGLLLFLWFVLALVREAWRHGVRHQAFTLAFVVTLCAASLTHSAFWLSTESHCLVLMSALIMAGLHARRRRRPLP
jgi:O-antigen ligase